MYSFLSKNGQVLAFGLGTLVTVIFLALVFGGMEDYSILSDDDRYSTGIFDFGLYAMFVLTVIAAVTILLFGIYQIATDPKGSMKGIIGFVVLLILAGIAYSMVSTEATGALKQAIEKEGVTLSQSKGISASMVVMAALLGIATFGLIVSEIRNFFK